MNIIVENSTHKVIPLDLLKAHLRIEHIHENEYLNVIIDTATEILEKNIGKSILEKKYKYIVCQNNMKTIQLPIDNVLRITRIIEKETKEELNFSVEKIDGKIYISLGEVKHDIEIEYVAGISKNALNIPGDLKYAILELAKNIYECTNESILELQHIKHVIQTYKTVSIN